MPQTVSLVTRLSNAAKWIMGFSLLLFAPQGGRVSGAFANENRLVADIDPLQWDTTEHVTEFCTPLFEINKPGNNEGMLICPKVEAQDGAFLLARGDELSGVEPVTPPTDIDISSTSAIPDATNSTNVSSTDTPPTTTPIVFYDATSQAHPDFLQLTGCMIVFLVIEEPFIPIFYCMLEAWLSILPDQGYQNTAPSSVTKVTGSFFSRKQETPNRLSLKHEEEPESEKGCQIATLV
jgi:hypothetical protein